jgi:hypothetical protein
LRWRKLRLKLSQASSAGAALEVVAEDLGGAVVALGEAVVVGAEAEVEPEVEVEVEVEDNRRPIPA